MSSRKSATARVNCGEKKGLANSGRVDCIPSHWARSLGEISFARISSTLMAGQVTPECLPQGAIPHNVNVCCFQIFDHFGITESVVVGDPMAPVGAHLSQLRCIFGGMN